MRESVGPLHETLRGNFWHAPDTGKLSVLWCETDMCEKGRLPGGAEISALSTSGKMTEDRCALSWETHTPCHGRDRRISIMPGWERGFVLNYQREPRQQSFTSYCGKEMLKSDICQITADRLSEGANLFVFPAKTLNTCSSTAYINCFILLITEILLVIQSWLSF